MKLKIPQFLRRFYISCVKFVKSKKNVKSWLMFSPIFYAKNNKIRSYAKVIKAKFNIFSGKRQSLFIGLLINSLFCLLLIRVDLASKYVVFKHLAINASNPNGYIYATILPGLSFVNARNYGVAWGSFQNSINSVAIFSSIGIALELLLVLFYFISKTKTQKFAILLVFAGGFGNIYDRITIGYVRDFIDVYIMDYHWPAFNFADSYIVIGAIMLIMQDLTKQSKNAKKVSIAVK
ncbi:MAG: signal peptidase II [Alphaproteobacteria bacterium]|nr:signal peptidase II [Rickettsiales bacterium]